MALFDGQLNADKRINSNTVRKAEEIALRDGNLFTKGGWSELKSFAREHDIRPAGGGVIVVGGGED